MRLTDTAPQCGMNWPPEMAAMYEYMRRDDVKSALHVNTYMHPEAWVECNHHVGSAISDDATRAPASGTLLPGILERGVHVVLYAGDQDLVCPALGIQRLAEHLRWGGQTGMGSAKRAVWTINDAYVGTWQTSRNLTMATLVNASHMAPYDAPYAAHDMLLRLMDVRVAPPHTSPPAVSTKVGGRDERVLVPSMPHDFATHTPGKPAGAPAAESDLSGSIVVWVLMGMAIALCLYMRRRIRQPRPGGDASASAVPYEAVQQRDGDDVEMGAFTLGDDELEPDEQEHRRRP